MQIQSKQKAIGYVCGLLAAFFWGIHSVIIRYMTLEGVSPFLIAGSRLYIGIITLCCILFFSTLFKRKKTFGKLNYGKFFWISGLALGVNFLLFQLGLKYTYASDSNLIQNFSPVAVLIISTIFFTYKIKRFSNTSERWWMTLFVVLVGTIGAALILANNPTEILSGNLTKGFGDIIQFVAMLLFALFVITSNEFSAQNNGKSSIQVTLMTLILAAIPVTFFVPFSDYLKLTPHQFLYIGFIGVFSTGIAYALWINAAKYLSVIPLALNIVYIGIITVLSETLMLGLNLSWKIVVGGLLMLCASFLAEFINSTYRERS